MLYRHAYSISIMFVLLVRILTLQIIQCGMGNQKEMEFSYLNTLKQDEMKELQFVFVTNTTLPPVEIPKPMNHLWKRQQKSDMNHIEGKSNWSNKLSLSMATLATTMKPTLMDIALELSVREGLIAMKEYYGNLELKLIENGEVLQNNHPAAVLSKFSAPSEEIKNQEMAAYATLAAAKALRKNYDFGIDFARHAHNPKISLKRTALEVLCPPRDAPICDESITERYRTYDGTCNNKKHPRYGAALMPFHRFLPPEYGDGVDSIRTAVDGGPLASSRFISLVVHGARDDEAPLTLMLAQWGQLLDHDMTSTAQPRSLNGSIPRCCGSRAFHPFCFPIKVPLDDPWLSPLNIRCLEFLRSAPAQRRDCVLSWREQINQATSYIDASPIYSSGKRGAENSRLFHKGLLFFGSSSATTGNKVCEQGAIAPHCIRSGDGRSSEQPGLLALHHVWVGEHNRIAIKLADLNKHWNDERIYQETRRIIIALFQHITYKEFLPLVLGREVLKLFDLEVLTFGYYENYDSNVNPTIANAFSAAAFRFGHSLVQGSYMRCDRSHNIINNNVSLHEEFQRGDIGSKGSLHRLLRGLANQRVLRRDEFITPELTNHLFQTPGFPFGLDLAAINIQRGRDHGLPSYTRWRIPCGLSPINDWHDFANVVEPESARRISHAYNSVHDIDLFVGGIAERPVIDGLVGPTFACIIAQQFSNTRKGDRFWYENNRFPNSFTPAQLQSIRQASLAQVVCRALNGGTLQPHIFLPPNNSNNKRIQCGRGPLKEIDLKPWLEGVPTVSGLFQFNTSAIKEEVPDHVFNIISIEKVIKKESPAISENMVLHNKIGFPNRPSVGLINSNVSKKPVISNNEFISKKPVSTTLNGISDKLDFKQGSVNVKQHKKNQKPIKGLNNKLNQVDTGINNTKRKVIINNVPIELRSTESDETIIDKPKTETILTENKTLDYKKDEETSRTLNHNLTQDKINTLVPNYSKLFDNATNLTLTNELKNFSSEEAIRKIDNLIECGSNVFKNETALESQEDRKPIDVNNSTTCKIEHSNQNTLPQTIQQNDKQTVPDNHSSKSSMTSYQKLVKYDKQLDTKMDNKTNIKKLLDIMNRKTTENITTIIDLAEPQNTNNGTESITEQIKVTDTDTLELKQCNRRKEIIKTEDYEITINLPTFYNRTEQQLYKSKDNKNKTETEDRLHTLSQVKIVTTKSSENDDYERTLDKLRNETTNTSKQGSEILVQAQFAKSETQFTTEIVENCTNTLQNLQNVITKKSIKEDNTSQQTHNYDKFIRPEELRQNETEMDNNNNILDEQKIKSMKISENGRKKTVQPIQFTRPKELFSSKSGTIENIPRTMLEGRRKKLEQTINTLNKSQSETTKMLTQKITTIEVNKTFRDPETIQYNSNKTKHKVQQDSNGLPLQHNDKDIDPLMHHSEDQEHHKRVTRKLSSIKPFGEVNKISMSGNPVMVSAILNRKLYNPMQQQHTISNYYNNNLREQSFKRPDFDDDKYHNNPQKIIVNGDSNEYEIEINIKNRKPSSSTSAPHKKRTTRYTMPHQTVPSNYQYYKPPSLPAVAYRPTTTKPPTIIIINENDYHINMQRPDYDGWSSSSNNRPQFNQIISSPYSIIATTTTTTASTISSHNNYFINTPISYDPNQNQEADVSTSINHGNFGITSFTSTVDTQSTINVNLKPDNTQVYPFSHNVNGLDYQYHQQHWPSRPITVNAPTREEIISNINIPFREHISSPFSTNKNHNPNSYNNNNRQSSLSTLSSSLVPASVLSHSILPELKEMNAPNQKLSDIQYDYNDRSLQKQEHLNITDNIDDDDGYDSDDNSNEDYFYDENITLIPKLRDIDVDNNDSENFTTKTNLNTTSNNLINSKINLTLPKTILNDNYVMPILNPDYYSNLYDMQHEEQNFANFKDIFSRQLNSNIESNNSNNNNNSNYIFAFEDQAVNDDKLNLSDDKDNLNNFEQHTEFSEELPKPIKLLNHQQKQQQQFWPFWHYNDNYETIDQKISKYYNQNTTDKS